MSAKVIMVASGKGGTGKSTLSVLVGDRLAAAGQRVLLVELDSGLRSVDIIAGVYGKTVYDIEDVLCGRCPGDKAVVESPVYPGLSVISAPYEGGQVPAKALSRLIQAMRPGFDFILLDTAAGMGAPFTAAVPLANLALLVLTPDPVALRDGRIVADAILQKNGPTPRLIVNRIPASGFANTGVRDLDECIDTVCVQLIGAVPDSPLIARAAVSGQALAPGSTAFQAVDNIAARILGGMPPLALR